MALIPADGEEVIKREMLDSQKPRGIENASFLGRQGV